MSVTPSFTKCSIAISLALATAVSAYARDLQGFKDDLFAYPGVLETKDDGDFLKIDYQERRDINGRDEIPEKRVHWQYVSLSVKSKQAFETVDTAGRPVEVFRAGREKGASFAVIFIHGRGGDRRLGANDFSFGGNFNRLKNLAVNNNGVYYAPSISSFDSEGVQTTIDLLSYIHAHSPDAPIVLSCASMGSFVCWGLAHRKEGVDLLSGMLIMGGTNDPDYQKSPAYRAKLPLMLTHGSKDSVYSAADQVSFYEKLRKKSYPVRFVLFETGTHGTPVRMTDWKDSLQWLLK